MTVTIKCLGWCAAPIADRWRMPYGYYAYLCQAANGIITKQYIAKDSPNASPIADEDYELPDADWSLTNPIWDKEVECEEIQT